MDTVDAMMVSETPLQRNGPNDWVRVCCAEGHPKPDWRPSGNLIQLFAVSTRDGLPSPQASLSLSKAPHRSSMVYDEADGIVRTSHMPPKILCAIVVSLRQELHVYQIPLYLDDRDEQTFDNEIMRRVHSYVETQSPADRRTYIRAGRVRLLALSADELNEKATSSVEKSVEWDRHVTKMIADYCSKDDDHEEPIPFMLEVRMEYEWFTIDETKTSLDRGIRQVLIDHRLTNMHREEFWSKKLLKALFTESTINQLLTEDSTWKQEAAKSQIDKHQIEVEQKAFLGYITADRTRLLAAMMRTRVEIACLYRLWKSGYKQHDNDPLDDGTFGNVLDHWETGDLCKHMASFNPITFTRPYDKREPLRHKRIGTGQVVPVLYDESNGKCKEIGKGSFGTVYRVKVQGDYHGFSANKDECYALKCLNRKLESTLEVDGEAGVLEMLTLRPHEHITPLYASWTREGMTYILLPKAHMSLQEFFRQKPSPDLTDQKKVIWLFTQLRGLAAAVGHIHHIGFNETNSTPAAAMEARKRKLHMGYHHDLKPGNVLVFRDDCLKVSDFGAAKIHQLVSGKSTVNTPFTKNSPYADETYGGPDRLVNSPATVGQPYDIWSLGCIYLEILLWATGYKRQLLDFAHQRMGKPISCHRKCNGPQSHGGATMVTKSDKTRNEESTTEDEDGVIGDVMENDSYWYQCEKGSCHLKPCVEELLRKVKSSHCARNELFLRLHQEIKKMLKIKPADRVSAGVVKDNIGNLLYQAEVNFIRHDIPDFGCEMQIGGFESDNTTYADFASNSMPVPGMQRSRSDTLNPPSPQRSPTGRIPGEEAIRDAGSSFESFSVERAQESGTDIDINIRKPSTRRRNTTRSSHSKQPAFLLIKPNGNTESIDHIDETPRYRTRRHRSLDSSGSFKFVERTHGGNVFHNSVQTTHLELSKHVLENERIICDTPQEQSRTAQKSETDDQPNLPNDGTSPGARPDQGIPSGGLRDLERVNSLELYYKISGEAIRRLNAEDSGELADRI